MKIFLKLNPKASDDEWRDCWEEVSSGQFPDLFLTDELFLPNGNVKFQPSALAYRQIADDFDYAPEYKEKLITKEKKRRKKKTNK